MAVRETRAATGDPAPLLLQQRAPHAMDTVGRRDRWPVVGVIAAVVAGVVLRFVAQGPLWLDEAQSVAIAGRPLHDLTAGLRHDGSPPLWYAMLHVWMNVFGSSPVSVRTMSGLPAVLALPAVWLLGRRLGKPAVGHAALVLLAVSPFAIRYAVEARMYSLMLLLSVLGAHAVVWAHRRGGWIPVGAVAVTTSALLYTHYYAVWLIAVVAAAELWWAVRRSDAAARRVLLGLAIGCVSFLPWLPVLTYQMRHTGAPWAPAPDLNAITGTIDAWMGGSSPAAQLSGLFVIGLVVLAVAGRPTATRRQMVVGVPFEPVPLRLFGVVLGTVSLAVVADMVARQAYAPRYLSMGLGLFLVVVAFGVVVLPSQRARRATLALLSVAGLGVSIVNATHPRSQAGEVAAAIEAAARPGDIVVYCPDQLGPSTSRLLHTPARQVVFPNFGSPHVVDWVDYRQRIKTANPAHFAASINHMAGQHTVFLVYSLQVKPLTNDCTQVIDNLVVFRGIPHKPVVRETSYSENMTLNVYPARR